MPSTVVSSAARQLSKLLLQEAKYLYAVKDKVEALREELSWIQTFLQDADTKKSDEEVIRMWVSQIRDFAYEAEDIVESYLHRVSRHRQEGVWNTLKWFSCICCDVRALHGVGSDIDGLKLKISELSTRMHVYGVKPGSTGSQLSMKMRAMELRRTSSKIEKEKIVGLEKDTEELVGKLARSDHKVVCIYGMGGLGKSTLAKMVYRKMHKEFNKNQVWVYVSQQFQTRNILEAILLKLTDIGDQDRMKIRGLRDEELPAEVSRVLKEKKCLVVLDDIWSEHAWDVLAPAFKSVRHSDCQSKLLLTTRNEVLLPHVDSKGFNHLAKPLKVEESWKLLEKISLSGNSTLADGSEIKTLGMEMAKHCNGLPLAVVVLGGILATKSSVDEWKKVQANIHSCLKNGSDQQSLSISQVLELSYDELPYYLKPCFLHLGNFPEDFEIPTKTLYRLWEIEGIVAHPAYTTTGEVSAESIIAENYLKELVNRCLVQLDRVGKEGKIKACRLHDLIRDMCLEKSKEERFLKVIEHGDLEKQSSSHSSSSLINQRFHRLVVYMHKSSDSLQNLISDQNNHHVRSLLLFPAGEVPRTLHWHKGTSESLKLVRVLHFDHVCIRSLPKDIGDMIHLRYLSLKGTRVHNLPSSIAKLRYLQTLDLRVCDCIHVIIPDVIWKFDKLKHLYLPNNWRVRLDVIDELLLEYGLVERKLRLRGLIQLETLENLCLEECQVKDLLKLEKLKKITVADYMVTEVKPLRSFLKCSSIRGGQLKKPLSLTLDANVLSKEPSILSSNPQLQFNKLHVSGKILMKLRYARMFPHDLRQLTLNDSELKDDPMPILERLFQLTELTLGENTFLGTEMQCTAGNFPKLTVLRLVQLTSFEEWKVQEGAMPALKNLYIYSCAKLKRVPSELPLGVKVGCRPCVDGIDRYGECQYMTRQAPAAGS